MSESVPTFIILVLAALFAYIASYFHQKEKKKEIDFKEAYGWYRFVLFLGIFLSLIPALFYLTKSLLPPLLVIILMIIFVAWRFSESIKSVYIKAFSPEITAPPHLAFSCKALLMSIFVGTVAFTVSNVLLFSTMIYLYGGITHAHEDASGLIQFADNSPLFHGGELFFDVGISVCVGYLAAYIANRRMILNGAISQIPFLIYNVCLPLMPADGQFLQISQQVHSIVPSYIYTMVSLGVPLLGAFGGYLYALRCKAKQG